MREWHRWHCTPDHSKGSVRNSGYKAVMVPHLCLEKVAGRLWLAPQLLGVPASEDSRWCLLMTSPSGGRTPSFLPHCSSGLTPLSSSPLSSHSQSKLSKEQMKATFPPGFKKKKKNHAGNRLLQSKNSRVWKDLTWKFPLVVVCRPPNTPPLQVTTVLVFILFPSECLYAYIISAKMSI